MKRKKFFVVNPMNRGQFRISKDFSFKCQETAPNIFSYGNDILISSTEEYKNSLILPMSLWSVIAIDLLEVEMDSTVLDMCCAPGMKLIYAGLLLKLLAHSQEETPFPSPWKTQTGSITGIDISRDRLSVTRALTKKYKVPNVRLLHSDSTNSRSTPVVRRSKEDVNICSCRMGDDKYSPYHTTTDLRRIGHTHREKYSRIIVDPECTQTSTIKYAEGKKPPIKDYPAMQLRILSQGISMLAPRGVLVYSTCTFEEAENEEVIRRVLKEHSHISRVDVEEETRKKYGVGVRNVKDENEPYLLKYNDSLFIAKLKYEENS